MVAPELLSKLQDDWKQLGPSRRDAFTLALRERVQMRRKVLPFRASVRVLDPDDVDREPVRLAQ